MSGITEVPQPENKGSWDNPTPQQAEIQTADTASNKIPAAFTVQHSSLNIFMTAMPNAKITDLSWIYVYVGNRNVAQIFHYVCILD